MTQHHKSEDYKSSAVDYYLTEDKSQQEVCKMFKCSARSLMRWVDKYKKDGEIKRHNRTPVAYKIDKNEVKYILEEIKKNKTITRVRHEPTKRFGKDIDINQKIKEFYEEVKKYKLEDIICIDETSVKSLQKRNHCYNEIGKRCVIKTQSQEVFKKYTGIFAVSTKGVLGWELYEKSGINTDRLYEFLETHITNKYKNKLIILDNASSHRNERIKELVNKHNKILYAVPYQHFTNSIENYFSMLKSRLYKVSEEGEGLTHEKLKANITNVIRGIPKEKYENIFKGAYNRDAVYVKNKTRKRKLKNYKV